MLKTFQIKENFEVKHKKYGIHYEKIFIYLSLHYYYKTKHCKQLQHKMAVRKSRFDTKLI